MVMDREQESRAFSVVRTLKPDALVGLWISGGELELVGKGKNHFILVCLCVPNICYKNRQQKEVESLH